MEGISYRVIRSNRKTIQLQISRDLEVLVRAPYKASDAWIEAFVTNQTQWVIDTIPKVKAWNDAHPEPTEEEKKAYIAKAKAILPEKLAQYSTKMGVSPAGFRITGARTRYGSCNARGNLCFSWRLMAYPDEVIDALVVHELAHLKHMNHQKEFYETVLSVMPDYWDRIHLLRTVQKTEALEHS